MLSSRMTRHTRFWTLALLVGLALLVVPATHARPRMQTTGTLYQTFWRSHQGWGRTVPISNGVIQWGSASTWTVGAELDDTPSNCFLQAQSDFVVGSNLVQSLWGCDIGWSHTVPIVNGVIQWGSGTTWMPSYLSSLPGSGSVQAQSGFVLGNTLTQSIWRSNQGWSRTVPIVSGVVQWGSASSWSGPASLSGLPGSGDIQTQSDFIAGSTLTQSIWRSNQGWSRTVPVVSGVIQWGSASGWSGPVALSSLPGTGSILAQNDFVIGN